MTKYTDCFCCKSVPMEIGKSVRIKQADKKIKTKQNTDTQSEERKKETLGFPSWSYKKKPPFLVRPSHSPMPAIVANQIKNKKIDIHIRTPLRQEISAQPFFYHTPSFMH